MKYLSQKLSNFATEHIGSTTSPGCSKLMVNSVNFQNFFTESRYIQYLYIERDTNKHFGLFGVQELRVSDKLDWVILYMWLDFLSLTNIKDC